MNYCGMKILIIDDHELFSEGLKLLLSSMDTSLCISIANSCHSALQIDNPTEFDLVLLDYHLSDMHGDESIPLINQSFPSSNIVIISSEESHSIIHATIEAGAAGFIPKSSSKDIMISALSLVVSGGIYLPAQAFKNLNSSSRKIDLEKKLTNRQKQTLLLAVKGMPNKLIANELNIAEGTVKSHLSSAFTLLGVRNRTEAVLAVARDNLLE